MLEIIFNDSESSTFNLPIIVQKDNPGNKYFSSFTEDQRNQGNVEVCFYNISGRTTEPTIEQKNALRYVIEHQKQLIEAFFKYTKDFLYPIHIGYIGYDEVSFPEIANSEELRKAMGLVSINIWSEHKEDCSYISFRFDFSGDYEHGTYLVCHKSKVLGWEEDLDTKLIAADLLETT